MKEGNRENKNEEAGVVYEKKRKRWKRLNKDIEIEE